MFYNANDTNSVSLKAKVFKKSKTFLLGSKRSSTTTLKSQVTTKKMRIAGQLPLTEFLSNVSSSVTDGSNSLSSLVDGSSLSANDAAAKQWTSSSTGNFLFWHCYLMIFVIIVLFVGLKLSEILAKELDNNTECNNSGGASTSCDRSINSQDDEQPKHEEMMRCCGICQTVSSNKNSDAKPNTTRLR